MVPGARQSSGRDKVIHLISQADRARKLAAGCRSPVIAELFILHAQLCEENAQEDTTASIRVPQTISSVIQGPR
jgi:hypothetical protein